MSEVGQAELEARLADIAAVKAGTLTLELAQKRARRRQRQSGLTPSAFYSELTKATGRKRLAAVGGSNNG